MKDSKECFEVDAKIASTCMQGAYPIVTTVVSVPRITLWEGVPGLRMAQEILPAPTHQIDA